MEILERISLEFTKGCPPGSAGIPARLSAERRESLSALTHAGGHGCPRSQGQACA